MRILWVYHAAMDSSGQGSERLNAQLLVDSIPGLIHTATPDGYLDYFNLNRAILLIVASFWLEKTRISLVLV
jgi:hypothetical protein